MGGSLTRNQRRFLKYLKIEHLTRHRRNISPNKTIERYFA